MWINETYKNKTQGAKAQFYYYQQDMHQAAESLCKNLWY